MVSIRAQRNLRLGRRRIGLISVVVAVASLTLMGPASSDYQPGIPPDVDPGTPVFSGQDQPVHDEPAHYDPTTR